MDAIYKKSAGLNGSNGMLALGVVWIGIGVFSLFTIQTMGVFNIAIGVFFLVFACWSKMNPIIRLYADHLEIKLAMTAPRHQIPYSHISDLLEESETKAFLFLESGKKISLPLTLLKIQDREKLLGALRKFS